MKMAGTHEKRKEPRRLASGLIRVRFHNPQEFDLEGGLVDVSPNGFRVAHECASLEAGATVEFWHSSASGQARVMWNRVLGTRIESGFLVLS